jgi:hypothetical protein
MTVKVLLGKPLALLVITAPDRKAPSTRAASMWSYALQPSTSVQAVQAASALALVTADASYEGIEQPYSMGHLGHPQLREFDNPDSTTPRVAGLRLAPYASVSGAPSSRLLRTTGECRTCSPDHDCFVGRERASADSQTTRSEIVQSDTVERVGLDDRFAAEAITPVQFPMAATPR